MNRRYFLRTSSAASVVALVGCARRPPAKDSRQVMTVRGPINVSDMGFTLTHEHVLANFQTHEEWARAPMSYERGEVEQRMLPYLSRIASLGCKTFVDATAAGLGRDATLLKRLAELSGLNILTVTFAPILVGIAIDFGVHLISRYEEEIRRGVSNEEALRKAKAT